jgi:hypothetical protein
MSITPWVGFFGRFAQDRTWDRPSLIHHGPQAIACTLNEDGFMTTMTARAPSAARRDVQVGLLFGAIVVTSVAVLLVSLLFPAPGEDGWLSYATVQPDRSFIWGFLTLAGANIVLTVVPVSLASVLLAPARGWGWVTAGGTLAVIGGAFYAVGVGGWAMLYFFGTDSSALDPTTATTFIESVNRDALRLFAAAGGGAVTVALGAVLLAIGLWRSGNVPKWLPLVLAVGSIITFILPTEGIVGALVEAPSAATSVLIGWYAWRRRHVSATG